MPAKDGKLNLVETYEKSSLPYIFLYDIRPWLD